MSASAPSHRSPQQGWEQLLFVAVLGLLSFAVILWLSGQLAAFLSSGSWPDVSLSQMGRVVGDIAESFHDPRRAWPRRARAVMPGPWVFYPVLAALLVSVSWVAI